MTSQRNPKQHWTKTLNETFTDTLTETRNDTINWHPKEALNDTLNETLKKALGNPQERLEIVNRNPDKKPWHETLKKP